MLYYYIGRQGMIHGQWRTYERRSSLLHPATGDSAHIYSISRQGMIHGQWKTHLPSASWDAAIIIYIIVETLVIDVMENGQGSKPEERFAKTLESYEECPHNKDHRSEKH